MSNQKQYYYIAALSQIKEKITEEQFKLIEYTYKEKNIKFEGRQTNEAATKLALLTALSEGELLCKIFLFVTPECFIEIGILKKSTIDYYKESLVTYLEQLKMQEKYTVLKTKLGGPDSVKEYINNITELITVDAQIEHEELYKKYNEQIFGQLNTGNGKSHIIMDYTGGSRLTSLVSIIFVRMLDENELATVDKILYGNILDKQAELVDCTKQYRLFELLEGKDKNTTDKMKLYENHGMMTDSDKEIGKNATKIESIKKDIDDNLSHKSKQSEFNKQLEVQEKKLKNNNSLLASEQKKTINKAKELNKTDPFSKMKNKNDKDLIKDFREEIINIFVDIEIITCPISNPNSNKESKEQIKKQIKSALETADKYYNNSSFSVLSFTRRLLKDCIGKNFRPSKHFDLLCKGNDFRYGKGYSVRFPKGISNETAEQFKTMIENKTNAHFKNIDYDDMTPLDFYTLMNVYYNTGFPFACYGNFTEYKEVQEYYIEKVEEFFKKFDNMDKDTRIIEMRKYYSDMNILENCIPQLTEMNCLTINPKYEEKIGSDFIKVLCKRIEEARPYRNAISHNINNEFSKAENYKKMADEIKEWLEEYRQMVVE